MNHLHTLAQHIATASGHNAFVAAGIVAFVAGVVAKNKQTKEN